MSDIDLTEQQKVAISAFMDAIVGILKSGLEMHDVAYLLLKETHTDFENAGLKLYLGSTGKEPSSDERSTLQ